MCMACEEMSLYDAYLDAIEAARIQAQPWQCEVTLISADGDGTVNAKPAPAKASPFACDPTE